jgi:hypothetical protein
MRTTLSLNNEDYQNDPYSRTHACVCLLVLRRATRINYPHGSTVTCTRKQNSIGGGTQMPKSSKRTNYAYKRVPKWWWHAFVYLIRMNTPPKWIGKMTYDGNYYQYFLTDTKDNYILDKVTGVILKKV